MLTYSTEDIESWFRALEHVSVLVIGDFMLDRYIYGRVERISPEAPVPVVNVSRRESRPGGAGNVLLNVHALGARAIPLGICGSDEAGNELLQQFASAHIDTGHILRSATVPTITKTRVLAGQHQMLRIDEEELNAGGADTEAALIHAMQTIIRNQKVDAVLFEDYDKGVISPALIQATVAEAAAHNIPVCVDPKKKNFMAYRGVTLFKPNLKELREGLGLELQSESDMEYADARLRELLGHTYTLATLSEKGIYFSDKQQVYRRPSIVRSVADVSGAGDSVIATATCFLAAGAPALAAAELANLSGGIVCEFPGVVPVDKTRLKTEAFHYLCKK